MNNEIISKSLGILSTNEKENEIVEQKENEFIEDYDFIRNNYYNILNKSSHLLEESIEIAKQSQSPRSFEAAAIIIKTISEVNKDLLHLNEKKNKVMPVLVDNNKTVNNNTVFVGSTAELQKFISELKNK